MGCWFKLFSAVVLALLIVDSKFANAEGCCCGVGERIYKLEQRVNELNNRISRLSNRRYYYWNRAWSSGVDNGVIASMSIYKRNTYTWLRVTWSGVLGMYGSAGAGVRCNRWYFTFNGQECTNRGPIDTIVYQNPKTVTVQRGNQFSGLCYVSGSGNIQVQLRVGACSGLLIGNAQTCYNSGCSVLIEELP